jgi:hypothetical protein
MVLPVLADPAIPDEQVGGLLRERTPGYDGWPLVMLRLAEVDVERLAELMTDAWRMRAPDALVGDLSEADALSSADLG